MLSQSFLWGLVALAIATVLCVVDPYLTQEAQTDGMDSIFISYLGGAMYSCCWFVARRGPTKKKGAVHDSTDFTLDGIERL